MKNKIYIIIAILVIGLGVFLLMSNRNSADEPNGSNTSNVPDAPSQISGEPITERGTFTCIPKLGDGPQTMECALGLQNEEGLYYGIRHLSEFDAGFGLVSPEIIVEVTGNLIREETFGPDGNKYDTVGTIEVESIVAI